MVASLFRVDIKSRSIIIVRRIIQSSRRNLYAARSYPNAYEGQRARDIAKRRGNSFFALKRLQD